MLTVASDRDVQVARAIDRREIKVVLDPLVDLGARVGCEVREGGLEHGVHVHRAAFRQRPRFRHLVGWGRGEPEHTFCHAKQVRLGSTRRWWARGGVIRRY